MALCALTGLDAVGLLSSLEPDGEKFRKRLDELDKYLEG